MTKQRRCMGRLAPRPGTKRALLSKYLSIQVPDASPQIDWTGKLKDWGMLANNRAGNCTVAAALHQDMAFVMAISGTAIRRTDDMAIQAYVDVTGMEGAAYEPVTGKNDRGAYMDDVMLYWQKHGLGASRIDGWLNIEPDNLREAYFGMETGCGLMAGFSLPLSAEAQIDAGQPWTIRAKNSPAGIPGSWGEHEVFIVKRDRDTLFCVTWGGLQEMSESFFLKYCDDLKMTVDHEFLTRHCLAGQGLLHAKLAKDLDQLGFVV